MGAGGLVDILMSSPASAACVWLVCAGSIIAAPFVLAGIVIWRAGRGR